ncbi:hypothetical protein ACHAPI_011817 [Fusarium lateritium]
MPTAKADLIPIAICTAVSDVAMTLRILLVLSKEAEEAGLKEESKPEDSNPEQTKAEEPKAEERQRTRFIKGLEKNQ